MGLFLPVLLLGLAQPTDLPVANNQPTTISQTDANSGSSSIAARHFTLATSPRHFTLGDARFRPVENFDHIQMTGDPEGHSTVCLTMRSYFFERRDGLAPEFVGMTTCDPARGRVLKRIHRHPARLVPAS